MIEQHTYAFTWESKINALDPGIMMASVAVGSSHLTVPTQAGALYGWQLTLTIILTNLFKHPFFRFSVHCTLGTGESLIEGYAEKSHVYLRAFLILCIASAMVNADVAVIVTAAVVKMVIPPLTFDTNMVSAMIMVSCLLILTSGRHKALDNVSKTITVSLIIVIAAVAAVAMSRGMQMKPDFIEPIPWALTGLGFLIVLMDWMPTPIEISAINFLWVIERQHTNPFSYCNGIFDLNVGYIIGAILATVFLTLGAYIQYGNGEEVQVTDGRYVGQLINMCAVTIGDWSRPLMVFITFACMYDTTIIVVDGYTHAIAEPVRLLRDKDKTGNVELLAWNVQAAGSGLVVILWFNNAMAELLKFAVITTFVAAPVFTWLNYRLIKGNERHRLTMGINFLAIIGLIYLAGFTVLFLLNQTGILAAPK